MTEEIDWPMSVGTLLLAVFVGWVVLAMYRPPHQAAGIERWARSAAVAIQGAVHPGASSARRP